MPNELKLTGFEELKHEFARLAPVAQSAAVSIVGRHATAARDELVRAYPSVTGALRAGVVLIPRVGRGIAVVVTLRSGSDHAHFYEFGTVHARPHPTFIPITGRERRAATLDVIDYIREQGLTVDRPHD